jgi:Rha family phage regulatory protein
MDLIKVDGEKLTTTSLLVAEKFGKRHKNVLQKIDALFVSQPEFSGLNFKPTSIRVNQPNGGFREERNYEMTEEGFAMIAMRFTGKSAEDWQIKFIEAFQKMRREIDRLRKQQFQLDRHEARENGKCIRATLGVAIKTLEKHADAIGGLKSDKHGNLKPENRNYYSTITKMVYKALFGDSTLKKVRDKLDSLNLTFLSICEEACADEIERLVALDMDYHEIYTECKKRVIATVEGLSASRLKSSSPVVKLVWENDQN